MRDEATRERFPGLVAPQVLPVPAEILPGQPAPWAHLDPASRRGLSVGVIAERLRAAGQHLAAGPPVPVLEEPGARADAELRTSAVLVALFDAGGEAHVVLTRRARHLRVHAGEVALPGGRVEAGESLIVAALREADEEVGLDATRVRPLGWLTPLTTRVSGSIIWPIVAALEEPPSLVPSPAEVETAFDVALADLAAEGGYLEEMWRRPRAGAGSDAQLVPISFFRGPADLIWGATARVLVDLVALALGVAPRAPEPLDDGPVD